MIFESNDAKRGPRPDERGYERLVRRAERWFERAAAAHAEAVLCRRGCNLCCHGLFDIGPLDAQRIESHVRALGAERRVELARRASRALARLGRVDPAALEALAREEAEDAGGESRFDRAAAALALDPCPALEADGSCGIYDARPLVCRLHGVPMFDPGEGLWRGGECELNLAPEGRESDESLWFDHERFAAEEAALEEDLRARLPEGDPRARRSVVAEALLRGAGDAGER